VRECLLSGYSSLAAQIVYELLLKWYDPDDASKPKLKQYKKDNNLIEVRQ
jgi:hypothetical protein